MVKTDYIASGGEPLPHGRTTSHIHGTRYTHRPGMVRMALRAWTPQQAATPGDASQEAHRGNGRRSGIRSGF